MTIPSYSKIYAIGHRAVKDIFNGPVCVQEKLDGSQFSFQLTAGQLICRSKGQVLGGDIPKLFKPAVEWVNANAGHLTVGWTYRAEALCAPKHNVLKYDRAPECGFVLFDIDTGICDYLPPWELKAEADRLNVEAVPMLFNGDVTSFDQLIRFMDYDSFLGGTKIEGFVVKNYDLFDVDKKTLMAKHVSEAFKEKHRKDPNRVKTSLHDQIVAEYKTEARWQKAYIHLLEKNKLIGDPKDIGAIIKEVNDDILSECREEIKARLFKHYWKSISKGATAGIAEWYKEKLAESNFQ